MPKTPSVLLDCRYLACVSVGFSYYAFKMSFFFSSVVRANLYKILRVCVSLCFPPITDLSAQPAEVPEVDYESDFDDWESDDSVRTLMQFSKKYIF